LTARTGVGYIGLVSMQHKRLVVAALVLLGVAFAVLEESLVHSDDGCVLETHCNACLFQLGTPGVVTEGFSLPRVVVAVDRVVPALAPSLEEASPRAVSARGPPPA
jgi:hypothetical protein